MVDRRPHPLRARSSTLCRWRSAHGGRPRGGPSVTPTTAASTRRGPSAGAPCAAELHGSTGSIGDCFDNSLADPFFGSLQLELLDRHHWQTRDQLASAIFDYVQAFYNPRRRLFTISTLSPADFESRHGIDADAA